MSRLAWMDERLRDGPCGSSFSTRSPRDFVRLRKLLQAHGPVHGIDVLADPDLRNGIKEYTRWPTIPQVFIHGKFVCGSDINRELEERGELKALIDAKPSAS